MPKEYITVYSTVSFQVRQAECWIPPDTTKIFFEHHIIHIPLSFVPGHQQRNIYFDGKPLQTDFLSNSFELLLVFVQRTISHTFFLTYNTEVHRIEISRHFGVNWSDLRSDIWAIEDVGKYQLIMQYPCRQCELLISTAGDKQTWWAVSVLKWFSHSFTTI